MDSKYIEQLLERYWQCETSLEEEACLRAFFSGNDVPGHLLRYKDLFVYQQLQQEVHLGEDFDARVLAEVEVPVVKAKRMTLTARFMPLFKAAAMMILLFTLGGVVKHAAGDDGASGIVYVHDQFENRQADPQVAYEGDSVRTLMKETSPKPRLEENNNR